MVTEAAALDPGLEAAIRIAISKPAGPITSNDLQTLVVLDATGGSIASVTGLEAGANLQSLYLANNNVASISNLSVLGKLTLLSIPNNPLTNLQAAVGLTNLTWL